MTTSNLRLENHEVETDERGITRHSFDITKNGQEVGFLTLRETDQPGVIEVEDIFASEDTLGLGAKGIRDLVREARRFIPVQRVRGARLGGARFASKDIEEILDRGEEPSVEIDLDVSRIR